MPMEHKGENTNKPRAPKPIPPEKMQALLLKLRKGADATVTLPQLLQVLTLTGGFVVRPCVGVVERAAGGRVTKGDGAEAQAEHGRISALAGAAWPTEGITVGTAYYAEVEPVESWERAGAAVHSFHYREGVGMEGVEVVAAMGESARFFPSWYGSVPRVYPHEILRWLKENTDYLARVSAALGMEPHVPASERTLENTGSCPCCFGNYKLEHHAVQGQDVATMVLHGYSRPRIGAVVGECMGRGRAPFEFSADGTRLLLGLVIMHRTRAADYLASLQAGTVTSISSGKVTFTSESPRWAEQVAGAIATTESEIRSLEGEIRLLTWLIDRWEIRPLPKPGERIRAWQMEARTAMRKAEAAAR